MRELFHSQVNITPRIKRPLSKYPRGFAPNPPFLEPSNLEASTEWAAICSLAGAEKPYIDEWLDYHLGLGFRYIYVFDNDRTKSLNDWKPSQSGVQVIPFKRYAPNKIQIAIYTSCLYSLRKLRHPPKWVAFLDVDEFMVFKHRSYDHVEEFLRDHLPDGSILIHWFEFGTANETVYRNEPVTSRFRYRLPEADGKSKCIAVLDDAVLPSVHHVSVSRGRVNSLLDPSIVGIHHYRTKSEEEFQYRRCKVGFAKKIVSCSAGTFPGSYYDDDAWMALCRLCPRYAEMYPV